jgi:hypothetical protein
MTVGCRVFGHDPAFDVDGARLVWARRRCGGESGEKRYDSEADARRYAAAFNRRDSEDLGRRAPLLGLLPLRIWRWLRHR